MVFSSYLVILTVTLSFCQSGSHVMSLLLFQDARNDAEQHIYQQLNAKIDEFMDLGWCTPSLPPLFSLRAC